MVTSSVSDELAELSAAVRRYRRAARSKSTTRAYDADFRDYEAWCVSAGFTPFPGTPEQVCLYLAYLARERQLRPASIRRRLAGLRKQYMDRLGIENCTRHYMVNQTVQGICRTLGARQTRKAALTVDKLRRISIVLPPGKKGLRDRALLLVGYAGALRRSELVGLDVEDLTFTRRHVTLRIRRSKGDQMGRGRHVIVGAGTGHACPLAALREWLKESCIEKGAVFRPVTRDGKVGKSRLSDASVCNIVKDSVELINLERRPYGAHSLRAGIITDLLEAGVVETVVMAHSRHKDRGMMSRYYRPGRINRENLTRKAGL